VAKITVPEAKSRHSYASRNGPQQSDIENYLARFTSTTYVRDETVSSINSQKFREENDPKKKFVTN